MSQRPPAPAVHPDPPTGDPPGRRRDPWEHLRALTAARIALGRAGSSLPTAPLLAFQQAQALARDAVHTRFDTVGLCKGLDALGIDWTEVASAAGDRQQYLQRPDRGRELGPGQAQRLRALAPTVPPDVVLIVADGLCAQAAMRHGLPMLERLVPGLRRLDIRLAPVVIARQARVALGDRIGEALGARLAVILLGERPGLSSPDSLGAYLTWQPHPQRHDAQRNCVSNIRPPEGLSHDAAAHTLLYLVTQSLRRQLSGILLKDDSAGVPSLLASRADSSPD
ncbi:MAG: ethanolamine ammonia-lyase subunit EutC [Burkholderiaceae bacterium]